jgi:opacity protein-like surface antigen
MLVHNNRTILWLFGAALLLALATFPAAAHQAESTQPVAINSTAVTATGTVAELTVNNQLTGVTLRYFGLKVDQGGSYALTGTGLDTLSDGARINVTGTLVGNVFTVTLFGSVALAASPARATPQAKARKTLSGTLAVFHKDFSIRDVVSMA